MKSTDGMTQLLIAGLMLLPDPSPRLSKKQRAAFVRADFEKRVKQYGGYAPLDKGEVPKKVWPRMIRAAAMDADKAARMRRRMRRSG